MTTSMHPNIVSIPFPRTLYNSLIKHTHLDPVEITVDQIWNFLERTLDDGNYFIDEESRYEFAREHFPSEVSRWQKEDEAAVKKHAAKNLPLVWKEITIDSGTEVRMQYGGEYHLAKVSNGLICDEDGAYSPSEWAKKTANNTSRNAWRDLFFREILAKHWVPAWSLRDQARQARYNPINLADF